ncbi:MAG: HesA/MoeB/ThiF family protein [Bacteroidales bacterium]|jgi:adenylyltransferase/sulfurtransferase|nr:HesA/MoeB/ThiF family protein [Bacteroidales bacterium]
MTPLTTEEQIRYNRQLIIPQIGEKGQVKLREASVLVVGAGGLGSPVLLYLAAAGVGKIGIVDNDVVDTGNLQRQVIYNASDRGCMKAATAAEKISQLNPLIKVSPYPFRLTADNAAGLLSDYDVAVDCCDNFATRYVLSDATLEAGIPMVYGAVYQFMGQASVFNYLKGPSYRSLFPEEMHITPGDTETPPGVIGVLPGIIGSVQACEVIKIITGAGDTLSGRLLQIDALSFRIEIITL